MKRAGFIFCLFFLMYQSSQAQSKMLMYSPECMQQFEYQINQESNGNFYVGTSQFFMITTDQNERFYFEIAQKPQQTMPEIPPNTLRCNEIALDELLVRQINNRNLALYLLIPDGKNISNYPVVSAAYMSNTDAKITFVSDEMEFDYLTNESNTRKNIARKGTDAVVKFESKNIAVCPAQYTFNVKSKNKERKHQTITLTSDVGIFKYNYASRKKEMGYNGEELVSVDGFNMDRYLDAVCNGYLDILKKEKLDKIRKEAEKQLDSNTVNPYFSDSVITSAYPTPTYPEVTYPTGTYPTTTNPVGTNPVATQPTTTQPTTSNPVGTQPTTAQPYSTNPADTQGKVVYSAEPYTQPIKNEAGGKVTAAQPNTTVVAGGQMPVKSSPDNPIYTTSDGNSTVVTTQPSTTEVMTSTVYTANPNPATTTNPNNKNPQIIASPDDECGHIYKDLDKGLYFDATTSQLANTSCGGVNYSNGVRTSGAVRSVSEITRYTYNPDNNVPKVNEKPVSYTNTFGEPALVSTSECTMTSDSKYHVVQTGETLYKIASYYNISVADLKQLNNIKDNTIQKCQRLVYNNTGSGQPHTSYAVTASYENSASGQSIHTVQKGETLYRIAKTYNMDVNTLKTVNGLSSNQISVGQTLVVGGSNSVPTTTAKGISAPMGRKIHVVKNGETLYRIAKMYNTSINRIKDKNSLSGNTISVGQTLVVE